jgi:hypothetical protein
MPQFIGFASAEINGAKLAHCSDWQLVWEMQDDLVVINLQCFDESKGGYWKGSYWTNQVALTPTPFDVKFAIYSTFDCVGNGFIKASDQHATNAKTFTPVKWTPWGNRDERTTIKLEGLKSGHHALQGWFKSLEESSTDFMIAERAKDLLKMKIKPDE